MLKDNLLNILKLIPLQNTIIFESSPDLTDSPYYMFRYLVEHYHIQNRYKLVWFIRDDVNSVTELAGVPVVCVNNNSNDKRLTSRIKRLYYNFTAKAILDSNMYVYKKRPEQVRIFVDHGMPLKEAVEYQSNIGSCDIVSVSSPLFAEIYAKYTDPDTIRICGLPRDEPLYDIKRENALEKKIIWMPTFRQHKDKKKEPANIFPLGIPLIKTQEELEEVNKTLKKHHVTLMLRLHPAQDTSVLRVKNMSNIILADNQYLKEQNLTLEQFLAESDALITDYSSVYYDYLYTGRPIGLTFEDVKEYTKTMKLIFEDIEKELPGRKMLTAEDLMAFIKEIETGEDLYAEERSAFMNKFKMEKIPSAQLLCNYLMERLEG